MKTVEYLLILSLSIQSAYPNNINLEYNEADVIETLVNPLESKDPLGDSEIQSPDRPVEELYQFGVDLGIINPDTYTLESFQRDERNVFKNLYEEYVSLFDDPIDYEKWVVLNNFGLLPDTQESVLEEKSEDERAGNKQKFINTVKTGDILITGRGIGGFVGHAAIMTTDNYVVEMPGGKGWDTVGGIASNNRRISKSAWYDVHKSDWTTVYRSPNSAAAREAASWATKRYFNSSGGSSKNIHITYKISTNTAVVNPSYCSKVPIQAYHYGTGSKKVINTGKLNKIIVPTGIPNYFLSPYKLRNMGKY